MSAQARYNSLLAILVVMAVLAEMLITACSDRQPRQRPAASAEKPVVYVVNYPLKYFAERIAGEHFRVEFPAPADGDPAFWRPGPEVILNYQQADLILLNGAAYAKWVPRVSLPQAKLVNTSAAFRDRYLQVQGAATHSHGPQGRHAHGDTAFTTWLDPTLAVEQARAIKDAVARLRPQLEQVFEAGFSSLQRDLLDLDSQMQAIAAGMRQMPLIASHPVYQYWTRRYGLNVRSVHWEPDEPPDQTMWRELQAILKSHLARWMIWEGDPLPQTIERLKKLGVGSVVVDPCGNAPPQGDFLSRMHQNINGLKVALAVAAKAGKEEE